MIEEGPGVVVTVTDRPRDAFEDPGRGDAKWFTLFSGDVTPIDRMSAGLMELEPGGVGLRSHRHLQPEIHHVVAGSGVLTIDGVTRAVAAGTSAFIPGDAEHCLVNTGDGVLRIFYVFPTDRFSEIVYWFTDQPSSG